ncbi:MAG: leucine-rich repeat domain-containing protein [Clostridia bacterium]|nr:leucine-rich repeat domain-containing protein [Clostridia bacterium]
MNKIWKGNKAAFIILIVLLVVLIAGAVGGISYAIWTRVSDDSQELNAPIDPYNPSEKYIVFRGLDADGNLLESDENAVSYAVVGYTGLVAELVIPASHNDKPVVRICTSNMGTDFQYRLTQNDVITSLQIPASVTKIDVDACSNMSILAKVDILGEDSISIADFAFANCPCLATFNCERDIIGNPAMYLYGSML